MVRLGMSGKYSTDSMEVMLTPKEFKNLRELSVEFGELQEEVLDFAFKDRRIPMDLLQRIQNTLSTSEKMLLLDYMLSLESVLLVAPDNLEWNIEGQPIINWRYGDVSIRKHIIARSYLHILNHLLAFDKEFVTALPENYTPPDMTMLHETIQSYETMDYDVMW